MPEARIGKMAPGGEGERDRDFRVLMGLAHGFMVSQVPRRGGGSGIIWGWGRDL